ncbi:unnamed protein product [Linum tenue]|uniref:Uncharacterized protein n=1 Tax=Linum tenue TaxID=586396 RepID=A0AAV0I6F7_9ROSI|nr:unnamed protein product [Linum tenue]
MSSVALIIDQEYTYMALVPPHDFSSDVEISNILYRDVRGATVGDKAIVLNLWAATRMHQHSAALSP